MAHWNAETEQLWRKVLNAAAWIGATADHEPEPAAISSTHQALDNAAMALRQHLEHAGSSVDAELADPATRPRLLALAETIQMSPAEVDWTTQSLRAGSE